MTSYTPNPERRINMIASGLGKYKHIGDVLLPEQRAIYTCIAYKHESMNMLEAGCGCGFGSGILHRGTNFFRATDLEPEHIRFARVLYPWITFSIWNIKEAPYTGEAWDTVVAVEVIEHIENAAVAIKNLLDSTMNTLIITSPNRQNPALGQNKPINDFHVKEYTPIELCTMIGDYKIIIRNPWDWEPLDTTTSVTPLVYEIKK